jgi:hypothetical protein
MLGLLLPLRNNLDGVGPAPVYHDAPEERFLCCAADPRTVFPLDVRGVAVEPEHRALDVALELRRIEIEAELRRFS